MSKLKQILSESLTEISSETATIVTDGIVGGIKHAAQLMLAQPPGTMIEGHSAESLAAGIALAAGVAETIGAGIAARMTDPMAESSPYDLDPDTLKS